MVDRAGDRKKSDTTCPAQRRADTPIDAVHAVLSYLTGQLVDGGETYGDTEVRGSSSGCVAKNRRAPANENAG